MVYIQIWISWKSISRIQETKTYIVWACCAFPPRQRYPFCQDPNIGAWIRLEMSLTSSPHPNSTLQADFASYIIYIKSHIGFRWMLWLNSLQIYIWRADYYYYICVGVKNFSGIGLSGAREVLKRREGHGPQRHTV